MNFLLSNTLCRTLNSSTNIAINSNIFSLLAVRNLRIVKKRITRLQNDIEFTADEIKQQQSSVNDLPPPTLINRNPRNLEQMQLSPPPVGFELDTPSVMYWNKLFFTRSGRHIVGKVVHHSGLTVVEVSSKELTGNDSEADMSTASNVGQLLARRCLESGIIYVHTEFTQQELNSKKVQAFIKATKENGLRLREPNFISPRRRRDL